MWFLPLSPWAPRSLTRTILGSFGTMTVTGAASYLLYVPKTRTFCASQEHILARAELAKGLVMEACERR